MPPPVATHSVISSILLIKRSKRSKSILRCWASDTVTITWLKSTIRSSAIFAWNPTIKPPVFKRFKREWRVWAISLLFLQGAFYSVIHEFAQQSKFEYPSDPNSFLPCIFPSQLNKCVDQIFVNRNLYIFNYNGACLVKVSF